jgi:phage minor structural protein
MLFILNVEEKVAAVLSNDSPHGCPYWNDKHRERLDDSLSTYEFECPAEHPAAEHIVTENFVALEDLDGERILFKIKNVDEYSRDGQYIKKVYAENAAIAELNGDIIRPHTLTGATAPQAMDFVLQGTQWTRGEVDYLGAETIKFENYETALAGLHRVAKVFEGELRYRVKIKDDRIVERYVDLLERRGKDTGKRFEYEKDIIGVRRFEDSTQLATALIPLGKIDSKTGKRMTIHSVNNNVDYIADEDARDRWSKSEKHIFGVYIDEDAQNPTDLMARAQRELNRRKNPIYTYEVDAVLLERKAGVAHEDVRLGDTIRVKDMSFEPPLLLEARVIEIVRSYTNPLDDKVTLGEFVPLIVSTPTIVRSMQSKITTIAVQAATAERVHKGTEPPDDTEMLWLDMSNPDLYVWKRWNGARWVPATPTTAQEIGAETPEGAQAKADAARVAAINEAVAQAQTSAEAAAAAVAQAEAAAAEARAKAYADGIVTAEEEARINDANAKLQEAKNFAIAQANAAKAEALAYADSVGVNAQAKAEWYAAVKNGVNLIKNIESVTPPSGYSWVTDYTPDGTKGKILKKTHTAGGAVNNGGFFFPPIRVNPNKTYLLEFYVKAMDTNSRYYWGFEEYDAQMQDNDAGNGPYIVGHRLPTQADVGQWVKHYALIAPHDSGAENSNTTEQSILTPDTDLKFYNGSTAYIKPKVFLTYTPTDPNKASTMFAAWFGLYEVGSDDGVFDVIQEEAIAQANLAETRAKAYSDGIVSDAEARAIAEAQAAADAAEAAAKAHADTKAAEAEAAAKAHADAQAALAEQLAKAYADGIVSDAEANAIAQAQAAADAAEAAAKAHADTKASQAEANAKAASEPRVVRSPNAPADTSVLWVKTGVTPEIMYRHNGSTWVPMAPENAGQLKYADGTTVEALKPAQAGADKTSLNTAADTAKVNGVAASTISTAVNNFNSRNDRKATTPATPTIAADGTAIDHTVNTDGSVDISFEWGFSGTGDAYDIDGFIVYVYSSTSSSPYTFGTSPASETVFTVTPDKRAFILTGVAADRYYTFGVQAYRVVDNDINASGLLKSSIAKPTAAGENPYRPSATVAFGGNITGTINGVAVGTITTAITNFNSRNDRKATVPANPTVAADGTAVDHTINTDGSADISFEWQFNGTGDAYDIDGFIVYVRASTSNSTYTFGTSPAEEQTFTVPADKRAFILQGVAANLYYTFGVQAYRNVDNDINASGVLKSSIVKATAAGENPYQPSSTVAFAGNITGTVNGQAASTITTAVSNFNSRNDRKSTPPAAPVVAADGTAIDHTTNTDGSVDISFEWTFNGSGDAYDIDGFYVYVRSSSSSGAYNFGTTPSEEQVYTVAPDKRAFILHGVPANRYYTFGVQAYRIVDNDINASGILKSSIVKATGSGENPYQPSSTVAFAGNITGTINGTAASTVVSNAAAGKSANDKIVNEVGGGTIETTSGAQSKADAARDVALQTGILSTNPIFAKWSGSFPTGYSMWSSYTPIKETTITRNGGSAVRLSNTLASEQRGIAFGSSAFISNAPNYEYIGVELDFYVVSGSIDGAGILLDWSSSSYRATLKLKDYFPTIQTGKWYTLRAVLKRPANNPSFTTYSGYLMANYSGIGSAVCDIVFDRLVFYEIPKEINADGTTIKSPTSGVTLDSNGLVVKDLAGISVTSVSKDGVNVKNGSFTLEDNKTGVRYSLARSTNLIRDHSFELLIADLDYPIVGSTGYSLIKLDPLQNPLEHFHVWRPVGNPRLNSVLMTDLPITSPFGYQSVAVDASNYVEQSIGVEEGQTYTVSVHALPPTVTMGAGTSVGKLVMEIEFLVDDEIPAGKTGYQFSQTFTLSTSTFGSNVVERFAMTVTAPRPSNDGLAGYMAFSMLVRFKSEAANKWVEVDGVQVVKGTQPVLYEPENELWAIRRGVTKTPIINDDVGSIRIGDLYAGRVILSVLGYDTSAQTFKVYEREAIRAYDADQNGTAIIIGAGGRTIIGAGEAAEDIAMNDGVPHYSEELTLAADGQIRFYVNNQAGYAAGQTKVYRMLTDGILEVPTGIRFTNMGHMLKPLNTGYIHARLYDDSDYTKMAMKKIYLTEGFEGSGARTAGAKNALAFKGMVSNSWAFAQEKIVTVTFNNASSAYADFTFDEAFASACLCVMATPVNNSSFAFHAAIYNVTKTGARVYLRHIDALNYTGSIQVWILAFGDE